MSDKEEQLLELLLNKAIEEARRNFYVFVKLMAPEILPEEFTDGRHIELICRKLQEVEESVNTEKPKRLQIFLPPGSMKSRLGNLFCAWTFGRHSNWCFIAVASDADLAIDNYGRPVKDLLDTPRYQAIFPGTALKKDVQASGRWDTTKKGRFLAKGHGQNLAGRRAHIAVCDDIVTEQTTQSDLKKINNWYVPGLRTRLLPKGAEVIINTRWYPKDISGHMEEWDKKTDRPWDILKIPALLDEQARKMLRKAGDPEDRYAIGTSFWPEFWPTEVLLEKKATTPPMSWAALYMQSPISESGAIVKRSDFEIWDEFDENDNPIKPPQCRYIVVSMDTAFSASESADFSAYSVWGIFKQKVLLFDGETEAYKNCMLLLDAKKGRWDFAELCRRAQQIDKEHRPDFFIIENKASGQSLIPELTKRGLPIMPYTPEKDKVYRLQACTPYFQSGRIWVPDRGFAHDLIDEVTVFPKGANDDMVDTLSQAILWLRDTQYLDNEGYDNYDEEDDDNPYNSFKKQGSTYWSSLLN